MRRGTDLRALRAPATLLLGALLVQTANSRAEIEGDVWICDSTDDRVLRLRDEDRDGVWRPGGPDRVEVFYDASSEGPDLSVPSHLLVDESDRVWLVDGGTLDAILRLEDLDGDGAASTADEVRVFYDGTADGPALSTANTIAWAPGGGLFVVDDGSRARWVLRLEDLDGDGDALDLGEGRVVFDASNAEGLPLEDPESLAVGLEGEVYVADSTLGVIYRLRDLDGDGSYNGGGESGVFFRSGGKFSLTDIDALVVGADGALRAGNEDDGTVVVMSDIDGDGVASRPDEVSIAFDGPASTEVSDLNDLLLYADGSLLLLDGRSDSLWIARDLDGDGDASDEGELSRWLDDGGELLATPSGLAVSWRKPEPSSPLFVRGDADESGDLEVSDAIVILGYLFLGEGEVVCLDALDTDDSGELTISDSIWVLNYLFKGGLVPPSPFPAPGVDPTADELSCDAAGAAP